MKTLINSLRRPAFGDWVIWNPIIQYLHRRAVYPILFFSAVLPHERGDYQSGLAFAVHVGETNTMNRRNIAGNRVERPGRISLFALFEPLKSAAVFGVEGFP